MEITLETLGKFVTHCGAKVDVLDTKGHTRQLKSGDPDIWDIAAKADKFHCEGKWYSRAEFARLMDERLNPAKK